MCLIARATAVVVVPESRMTTWPGQTKLAAAAAIFSFSRRCNCSFSPRVRIAQRGGVERKRAAVSALQAAHLVQRFQIFANGDERSRETTREVFDHHAAIALRQFKDFAPPLFCKHGFRAGFRFLTFSYYFELGVIAWHKGEAREQGFMPEATIICASANPAMDRRLHMARSDDWRNQSRSNRARASPEEKRPHVAMAARALGARAAWIGFLGGAIGQECARQLEGLDIEVIPVPVASQARA